MKKTLATILTAVFLGASGLAGSGCGCTNARTPAGHEGYVYNDPYFIGEREFIGTQKGPTSTGLVWKDYVVNIDMRPKTYSEPYQIITNKDVNLKFESHARISLKSDSVKNVIEKFGAEEWYQNNVKEQYRAVVREEVRKYDPFEVKTNTKKIADVVLKTLQNRYEGTPFVFETVDIGNIDYPDQVEKEIEQKVAAKQKLERKDIEEQIAAKDAEIRVTEAKGLAQAQEIINDTLTSLYVQHEAIEAYKTLAESPNTTFIIAPTSPNGTGMPVIIDGNNGGK